MDAMCVEKELSEFSCNAIGWGLYVGYFLLIAAILVTIALFFMNALRDIKVLIKSAVGSGILGILFLVSYSLSDSELSTTAIAEGVTETSSKFIGGGLLMFYIVFFLSVIGLIFSEINKAFK